MTDQDVEDLFNSIEFTTRPEIEYRAYYDKDGKIISYTTEKLPGDYILITRDQYAESRHDAKVIDSQLTYTHRRTHVHKLVKNNTTGISCSKYDISVIQDDGESTYYTTVAYEIKR